MSCGVTIGKGCRSFLRVHQPIMLSLGLFRVDRVDVRGWRPLFKASYSSFFRVESFEDGNEFSDGQQIYEPFGQVY